MPHFQSPIVLSPLRILAADAVTQHRMREAALDRAGHELEVLIKEVHAQGLPIVDARARQLARLVIGTYHAALEAPVAQGRG